MRLKWNDFQENTNAAFGMKEVSQENLSSMKMFFSSKEEEIKTKMIWFRKCWGVTSFLCFVLNVMTHSRTGCDSLTFPKIMF